MRIILLLFDKPEAEQNDADRNNNDASAIHENLIGVSQNDFACRLPPFRFNLRDWIVPAIAPWMTAANTFRREPAADDCAVRTNRLNRVLRTSRREAAAATEEKKLRWRKCPAINANGKNENVLDEIHN
jgi:hypothetical protein